MLPTSSALTDDQIPDSSLVNALSALTREEIGVFVKSNPEVMHAFCKLEQRPEWIRSLLESHADPNSRNALGETPLMTHVDSLQVVETLLEYKASTVAVSANGARVLDFVRISHDTPRRLRVLLQAGSHESLAKLALNGLLLTTLPEELRQAPALRELDVSTNNFASLPIWLGELKLEKLHALENPLQGQQATALALDEKDGRATHCANLLRFLQACATEGEPLRQVQVLVLGHFCTGKTSVVDAIKTKLNRLRQTRLPHKGDLDRTTEVLFSSFDDPESKLTFLFRDFPGQVEYYAANRAFFSFDNTVVIVVFNATDREHLRQTQINTWWESCSLGLIHA